MPTGRASLIVGLVCLILVAAPLHATPRVAAAPAPAVQIWTDPDAGATPVVQFIAQAHSQLDAEVYLVTSKPVLSALEDAAQRGVRVRVLLEQHPYGTGTAAPALAFRSLAAHGVQVRWSNPAYRFTHAKYMVAPASGRTLICTCNWTTSAFTHNREFGLIDSAPSVVREAEAVFNADWTRSAVNGTVTDLVVSPLDARADLLRLITGARRTLDVYAEEVQDRQMIEALSDAERRGVHVRFITTDASAGTRALAAAGVQVVLRKTPYIHAKAIVSDGTTVFVGSENLSSTSLDRNREMGLILTDRTVIATVEHAFTVDLAGATPARGATPAALPTATPRAGSVPTAAAGTLAVRVSVAPNPTSYGTETTVSARTTSGASCTVAVRYASGHAATSRSLGATETADRGGRVSWSWRVSTRTPGQGSATVTCALARRSGTGAASFVVR